MVLISIYFTAVTTQLQECLQSLIQEQHHLITEASGTTLSSERLLHRLLVMERYLVALSKHVPKEGKSPTRKKLNLQANLNVKKRLVC
jgi:hypothetical protein